MSQTQPFTKPQHFKKLSDIIESVSKTLKNTSQELFLIAIDGRGGSGKSTLATEIQRKLPNVTIVEMDDFYYPSSQKTEATKIEDFNFDWQRMRDEVLMPLYDGKRTSYQRFDWPSDILAEWHTIEPKGIVVIEGCFSARQELIDYYDLVVWVDLDKEICLRRGLEREFKRKNFLPQEEIRKTWLTEYQPLEDLYIQNHQPQQRADIIFETI